MDWINLHIPSALRSEAYIGSSPAERGTWLSVLAYACEVECSGRLGGAASWKDRQWQQTCGVTLREVRAAWRLLRVDGDDVVVNGYPLAAERQVVAGRKHGKAGAMVRWSRTPPNGTPVQPDPAMPSGMPSPMPSPMPSADAKGEGKGEGEGEGQGVEGSVAPTAPPPGTDEDLARRLGTWIRWRSRDNDRTSDNVAEVATLVARFGVAAVQQAAERVVFRERRKAWPNEILPELLAAQAPKQAAGQTDHEVAVAALVATHGWERVREVLGIPALRSAEEVISCLVAEAALYDTAVRALGTA